MVSPIDEQLFHQDPSTIKSPYGVHYLLLPTAYFSLLNNIRESVEWLGQDG